MFQTTNQLQTLKEVQFLLPPQTTPKLRPFPSMGRRHTCLVQSGQWNDRPWNCVGPAHPNKQAVTPSKTHKSTKSDKWLILGIHWLIYQIQPVTVPCWDEKHGMVMYGSWDKPGWCMSPSHQNRNRPRFSSGTALRSCLLTSVSPWFRHVYTDNMYIDL